MDQLRDTPGDHKQPQMPSPTEGESGHGVSTLKDGSQRVGVNHQVLSCPEAGENSLGLQVDHGCSFQWLHHNIKNHPVGGGLSLCNSI